MRSSERHRKGFWSKVQCLLVLHNDASLLSFAVTVTTSFVSKIKLCELISHDEHEGKFIPSLERKQFTPSLLTVITCSWMISICRIFFLLTLIGLLFHCGFIYSIIARPISVGFCILLILTRCTARLLYFLLKRVSMKQNL